VDITTSFGGAAITGADGAFSIDVTVPSDVATMTVFASTTIDGKDLHAETPVDLIPGAIADAGILTLTSFGDFISVPLDFATIGEAIDAAKDGQLILVGPGVYNEQIDFNGKAITISAIGGAATIDGSAFTGPVVRFTNGEGPDAVLEGFTITGGEGGFDLGGGLHIANGAAPTLSNLLLVNNGADLGGGARCIDASPTFLDCVFVENLANVGGAVHVSGATSEPAFFGCAFSGHTTTASGGAVRITDNLSPDAVIAFVACSFVDNTSSRNGGAIHTDAAIELASCVFQSNLTTSSCNLGGTGNPRGGAVHIVNAHMSVTDCLFANNTVHTPANGCSPNPVFNSGGGAISAVDTDVTIADCEFTSNSASGASGMGGAIRFQDLTPKQNTFILDVQNCSFTGCHGRHGGGAIANVGGMLIVNESTFTSNVSSAGHGAAMFTSGESTITHCGFEANAATNLATAGALQLTGDFPKTITHCTFIGNSARDGGAIEVINPGAAPYLISDCDFEQNASIASFAGGGAISLRGDAVADIRIVDCSFIGNTSEGNAGAIAKGFTDGVAIDVDRCLFLNNVAASGGGAIYTFQGTPQHLVLNSIFIGNQAGTSGFGQGGAIRIQGRFVVANCTIVGNEAPTSGGGIALIGSLAGQAFLSNCIVRDNIGPDQIFNNSQNSVINFNNVSGGFAGEGNIDADPLFIDPDNGDYRLGPFSPCIDAGSNLMVPPPITFDLDGNPRFVDDAGVKDTGQGKPPLVDIGAYERQENSK
jgi:predicted outer membrane repeat protein